MNLGKLFEMQRALDEKIVHEKGLENLDLLPNTILALQVELGECANEWRGFKHWSHDQEPRREKMLVELVDCLHFALSIGLQGGKVLYAPHEIEFDSHKPLDLFGECFYAASQMDSDYVNDAYISTNDYNTLLYGLLKLGESLGFTEEEIENAYLAKNQINHERQATGY